MKVPIAEEGEEIIKVKGMITLIKAGFKERKTMSDAELSLFLDRYCLYRTFQKLGVIDIPTEIQ